jgi:hypothetical protein
MLCQAQGRFSNHKSFDVLLTIDIEIVLDEGHHRSMKFRQLSSNDPVPTERDWM